MKKKLVPSFEDKFMKVSSFYSLSDIATEAIKTQRFIEESALSQIRKFDEALSNFTMSPSSKEIFISEAFKNLHDSINISKSFKDLYEQNSFIEFNNTCRLLRESFAINLLEKVNQFHLRDLCIIPEEEVERSDEIEPPSLILPSEYQKRIQLVDHLPIKLLQAVLRDPRHMHNLNPREFEEFTAAILEQLGFLDIILTPPIKDGGRDVIASKVISGIPISFYFECKKYAEGNKVQLNILRALLGTIAHDATKVNKGVLVTTSYFTKGSKDLIMEECRLDGKDYDGILGWIEEIKTKNH